jgi:3-hydroxyacyl-CoA dehydrogenase/enoyl-CoA hydratase/3-hydroxybutyryl-CoA epimerase
LVDALVPPGMGRTVAREVLLGARKLAPHRPGRKERAIAAVPLLRNFVFGKARGAFAKAAPREHYPAPHLAMESVAAGFHMGEVAAYRNEARLLGEAIVTDASKNLTWLFKVSGQSKQPSGLDLARARDVKRLAVVGAGVMGGGIAWLSAEGGLPIRVKDIAAPALAGALDTAAGIWSKSVRRRRLTAAERDRRLERLSFTLDYTGFHLAQVAIEAVIENLDVKRKVMNELEAVMADDTVLATNTSSLRVGDIAKEAIRPERIVGLHFFNPVDRMPLVEVVAGPQSAAWAVATAYKLALDLGKTPILVKDGPGFLVNRLLAFYLGEALALFESGADPEMIDDVLAAFGMPMGPFALLDQIGLDVADKVTHVVEMEFGERLPRQATLGRLVERGDLGRKSGRGFYVYAPGKPRHASPGAAAAAGSPVRRTFVESDVLDRLVLPMVNEAARCLDEGIVTRPLDVDLGMVMGTGFPPFRGGLLRYADARGVGEIAARLNALTQTVGERMAPSEELRRRAGGFYASHHDA